MGKITYSQVQDLVRQVPETKLPFAYQFLVSLAGDTGSLSAQFDFWRLPFDEQRRILMQQAEQMVSHYEQTAEDREAWQAGDFIDEN